MDQCTHEVRAEYWKGIIKACGQRPAGQSAKNWMEVNGICEQSYYHWQRKFRQKAYENYRLPWKARTVGEMIAVARQESGARKLEGHDIMAPA